ncbi:MAG TPA: class III extradiol ring-cleavage dioxygenase [Cellvibrio sp.]
MSSTLMPVVFVPHGGGPMPLLGDASHRELTAFMQHLAQDLPPPQAILVISAHWEETIAHVSSAAAPEMMFDYYGFPPESYEFRYPAPGHPPLAEHIAQLLQANHIPVTLDNQRGYDHGTFVPLLLSYPRADIPVVQLSLLASLDPAAHIALGNAIAPLREQGVLILGSGMSFHNMRAFFSPSPIVKAKSDNFDQWLVETLTSDALDYSQRSAQLTNWTQAPDARFCHPREEHLLPLLVCFGAAKASPIAQHNFGGYLLGTRASGFLWQ